MADTLDFPKNKGSFVVNVGNQNYSHIRGLLFGEDFEVTEYRNGILTVGFVSGAAFSISATSDPPTAAQITSIFGDPADVGRDFVGFIDNGGASTDLYMIYSNGTDWWISTLTKAT